jgi:hypothetical protein
MKLKPKIKYKIIDYKIYPFEILVSFHDSFEELESIIKKKLPGNIHDGIELFKSTDLAKTVMFSNGTTCIWFTPKLISGGLWGHGVISHEVFHAVDFLMNKIGIRLSNKSDEAYAYLIQYLTNEIYKMF